MTVNCRLRYHEALSTAFRCFLHRLQRLMINIHPNLVDPPITIVDGA